MSANTSSSRLKKHDPAFSEAAFTERVSVAFQKIQAAWCGQDLTSVRPFISDGVHERFSLQFDEQRQLGYREKMDSLKILQVTIADLGSEGLFDEVAVKITAEAADYRVSLRDGSHVSGSKAVEPFSEYWSFLRRRGTQTAVGKNGPDRRQLPQLRRADRTEPVRRLQELQGPAPQRRVRLGPLRDHAGIGVDRPVARHMPGVSALQQRDADFDPLVLEDRASVIFWRKVATDRTGKIAPLRKMACARTLRPVPAIA